MSESSRGPRPSPPRDRLPGRDFYKASGGGNDFIVLPPGVAAPSPEQIRAWCRRGLSIGADGVIALAPVDDGEEGEARMTYWNADGGRSTLCLNGSRCAARLAFELGWGRGDRLFLHTDAGRLECTSRTETTVALELPAGLVADPEAKRLEVDGSAYECWLLGVGVPHLVLFWDDDLASVPMDSLGPALRSHPELAPSGANVNFVEMESGDVPTEAFAIRTWERGVEAETLACGTGVVAAGVAGLHTGRLCWPAHCLTAGGFRLTLEREPSGRRTAVRLVGDARLVAKGQLLEGAEDPAEPPPWSPVAAR